MVRRSLVVVVTLATLGCGDDDGDPADGGSAIIVTTTVATAPTSSPPGSPDGTTTSAPAGTAPTSPEPPTGSSTATTAPPAMGDPEVTVEEVARLERPVDLSWRAGDPTLFVVEQVGRVSAVDPLTGDARPVLDITDRTDADGERGLLGLAFSPDGDRAYVNYTDDDGDTVVAEYEVATDGTLDPATRRVLLEVNQPYANHNGGDLATGPDGTLFVALGDGGSGGDPERRSLRLDQLLGKILRIDPTPSSGGPYTVPADNPFVGVDGALPEIFAMGLRNPWKFTFDPLTGDLWIADVGQNRFEEVNLVRAPAGGGLAGAGHSFGWSAYEGTEVFNPDVEDPNHTPPVLVYEHGADGCSISGGAPYRGSAIPELQSGFVYSDYCSGNLWALDVAGGRNLLLATLGQGVTGVMAGPDGELYVTSTDGSVRRVVPVG